LVERDCHKRGDEFMGDIGEGLLLALRLVGHWDADLVEIVALSLRVSLTAVLLATLVGLPLGAALALFRFRGRTLLVVLVDTAMGLPPVVLGLLAYLLLSRSGPLGALNLLFTPEAMILVQWLLATPIVAGIARPVVAALWEEYRDLLRSLNARAWQAVLTVLWEGRVGLFTAVLAGFGRAIAEVGAVLVVGGNILHVTRVMTTAIALETSKGDLALAMGLGIVLVALSAAVNGAVYLLQSVTRAAHG
jgi:tungstate transport system permease protein